MRTCLGQVYGVGVEGREGTFTFGSIKGVLSLVLSKDGCVGRIGDMRSEDWSCSCCTLRHRENSRRCVWRNNCEI